MTLKLDDLEILFRSKVADGFDIADCLRAVVVKIQEETCSNQFDCRACDQNDNLFKEILGD